MTEALASLCQSDYPISAIKMMIHKKLFEPQPQPHPQLSLSQPPNKPFPNIPFPSLPHTHERIRIHKSTLQLQLLLHPDILLPHPHPVAVKSLIEEPPNYF